MPDVLIGRVMRTLFGEKRGVDQWACAGLIVQVWSEALRSERPAATLKGVYGGLRVAWTELVEVYRETGVLPVDVPSDHVARTLIATAQGFIAQLAMFGDSAPDVLEDGLRGPMSMDPPKIS